MDAAGESSEIQLRTAAVDFTFQVASAYFAFHSQGEISGNSTGGGFSI